MDAPCECHLSDAMAGVSNYRDKKSFLELVGGRLAVKAFVLDLSSAR